MGQPIREVPRNVRQQLKMRSANFALYGDLSSRVPSILADLFPSIEIYSIDESFVSFDGIAERDYVPLARLARERILQWTGVPCCVGIGPTKSLARMAKKIAKTGDGVWRARRSDLARFPIGDAWDVGRK